MIVLDLSILNQKGTPMFYSDIFANRPVFGIAGRIFISTDTAAIYRDTGSAWDLIADGGGGTDTNIYNTDGTLTGNRIVSSGGFDLSFTSTTYFGTAAIGSGTGKLIVGSSIGDNGIQVFGANSPSIRIDNAQNGGSQRFVIGLSTALNNFIQGSVAGEFCISTATSGALLFGMWQTINAIEVMRISTLNNLQLGSANALLYDSKFQLTGDAYITGVFRETITKHRDNASTSLILAYNGKLIEMNVATANTLTIPVAATSQLPVGAKIDVTQYGAGQTQIVAASGVTLYSAGGATKLRLQYSGATLIQADTDVWYLFGDITT